MNAATIFALSSAMGRAAVAIVRVSGPRAGACLDLIAGERPHPRVARLARLRDPGNRETIDHALVLWFPGPHSFTGEDCAEFQVHGGRSIVAALLAALARLPGLRPADAGEFTRRAVANGKLTLPEVEGLADLIDAQTEAQRRQALRQMDGALDRWAKGLRGHLLRALAAAEAAIDFADEGDVAGDFEAEVRMIAREMTEAITRELAQSPAAERVREGVVVALAGPPNAGKSTLLNALARRDVAIVSPHAGTTRDPIAVQLDLDGALVTCVDTAGLREAKDPVEQEGIARARRQIEKADLILWLFDARAPAPPDAALDGATVWRVATHVDLTDGATPCDFAVAPPLGTGVADLVGALKDFVGDAADGGGVVTRLRHRRALEEAGRALAPLLAGMADMEIAAVHLREAASCLDRLVGAVETEEILGEILARFCIGK